MNTKPENNRRSAAASLLPAAPPPLPAARCPHKDTTKHPTYKNQIYCFDCQTWLTGDTGKPEHSEGAAGNTKDTPPEDPA